MVHLKDKDENVFHAPGSTLCFIREKAGSVNVIFPNVECVVPDPDTWASVVASVPERPEPETPEPVTGLAG